MYGTPVFNQAVVDARQLPSMLCLRGTLASASRSTGRHAAPMSTGHPHESCVFHNHKATTASSNADHRF